ncbi:MAG: hypothetical protein GXX91_14645 [Verrucomicrobiaceae bacterium]|nr:hypothetical protein [Verrucomicrobiaceae bacterium]
MSAHLAAHPDGEAAFTFDRSAYQEDLSSLPIGVFDSGVGGLTVLEAILTLDVFDNDNLQPGPDGRPDFAEERFVYLGDQANMPYGNYANVGKVDYLRELILKDMVFLLGKRYHQDGAVRRDKPPVKAIVIACNTATAYGLEDIKSLVQTLGVPVIVVGVVEAGARGLLSTETDPDGAIGVMATVGTCASEVYPRTIQSTLGRAGRGIATITQFGSPDLAAIIEGDPSIPTSASEQVARDVRALVEAHRKSAQSVQSAGSDGERVPPLSTIMLGCTHFPLVREEIETAFSELRRAPDFAPYIAEKRIYIDPAEWTARQLFRELASAGLRASAGGARATDRHLFFLSAAAPSIAAAHRNADGGLEHEYKYGRETGRLDLEDTIVVPMTRESLPGTSRHLIQNELPAVWERLP